jgi:hypothetical protein
VHYVVLAHPAPVLADTELEGYKLEAQELTGAGRKIMSVPVR